MPRKRPRNAPLPPDSLPVDVVAKQAYDGPVVTSFFVTGESKPKFKTTLRPVTQYANGQPVPGYEVRVELAGVDLLRHAYPPPMAGKRLKIEDAAHIPPNHPLTLPKKPAHLPFVLKPPPVPRPRRWRGPRRRTGGYTTVFPPESRSIFNTTAYPWSAFGQCSTGSRFSGALVGPRHVLTCSHGVNWNSPPGHDADWFTFTPDTYLGSAPFGTSYGTHVYYYRRVGFDPAQPDDAQFDYAVVVLNDPLGEAAGWFGVRTYDDAWDGLADWWHAGYPNPSPYLGTRPTYEDAIALDGDDTQPDTHQVIRHRADAQVGQSGGPMFGYWAGEGGPRAVAVQSRGDSAANEASGGGDLVDLVVQARTDHP